MYLSVSHLVDHYDTPSLSYSCMEITIILNSLNLIIMILSYSLKLYIPFLIFDLFLTARVSSVPIVDDNGILVDVYCRR